MSVEVTSALWDCGPNDSVQMLIMQALGDRANANWDAWPGLTEIISRSKKKKRYVLLVLAQLEKDGWLQIEHHSKVTGGKGNCYHLNKAKILGAAQCTLPLAEVQPDAPTPEVAKVQPNAPSSDALLEPDTLLEELNKVHSNAPGISTSGVGLGALHDTDKVQCTTPPPANKVQSTTLLGAKYDIAIRKNHQEPSQDQKQPSGEPSTRARDRATEERDFITALFFEFCRLTSRNPTRYTLNEDRRKKATLRLRERVTANAGDFEKGCSDLHEAMTGLIANEFCMVGGWNDWTANLMKSTSELEKRLNWKPRGVLPNAKPNIAERQIEHARQAIQTIRAEDARRVQPGTDRGRPSQAGDYSGPGDLEGEADDLRPTPKLLDAGTGGPSHQASRDGARVLSDIAAAARTGWSW